MERVKKINIDDVNLIESYEDIINVLARTKRSDLFLIIRTIEQLADEVMELLADKISLRIMKADQEALEESRYLDSEQWRHA